MDIPIKTAEWMQDGDFMLIQNGTNAIVKLDGTDKQTTKPIKKAKFAIYHKGKVFTDKDVESLAPTPPIKGKEQYEQATANITKNLQTEAHVPQQRNG